jgi:predicted lipoprotein with Yx(FWY)xxD motif
MRRTAIAVAAAVAAAVPIATAAAAPAAHSASGGTVIDAVTSRGHTILVDRNGLGLYIFTKDRGAHNSCAPTSGCSSVWPTLYTKGRPVAGRGVKASLLGTIKVGSRLQVTYAGHPLYEYAQKSFPGFTSYVGVNEFGGYWYAISPAGKVVK